MLAVAKIIEKMYVSMIIKYSENLLSNSYQNLSPNSIINQL